MAKPKNKFRSRLPLVGIFLLLVFGVCFFMYPIVSNWYTEYSAKVVIREYDEAVQKMGYESIERFAKQAENYNRTLAGKGGLSYVSYEKQLAVTEAIGYLEVPRIGVYYPIYHGLSDSVLQKGIGHMEGTSLPIGGESTHCVLAGHTGLPSSKLFTDLDTLSIGDTFYVHVLDRVLMYRIDQIKNVGPDDSDDIRIIEGMDYVTLVTCTPYGVNNRRLLVRGIRTQAGTVQKSDDGSEQVVMPVYHTEETQIPVRTVLWYIAAAVMAIMVLGVLLILLFPVFKKKKGTKHEDDKKNNQNNEENSDSMED